MVTFCPQNISFHIFYPGKEKQELKQQRLRQTVPLEPVLQSHEFAEGCIVWLASDRAGVARKDSVSSRAGSDRKGRCLKTHLGQESLEVSQALADVNRLVGGEQVERGRE